MAEPRIALGQPVPFRILLDDGARLARRHFRAIFWPVALPVAVAQVLMVVAQNRLMGGLVTSSTADPGLVLGGAVGLGLASLLFLAVYGVAFSAMGAAAVDAAARRPVEMGRSWRFVLQPRVLATLMAMGIAMTVGFICCFFPGLWLVLLLGFAVPVMVEEGEVLGEAWRRSAYLARYNPQGRMVTSPMLKIFVFLVVGMLISYALSFALQMPLALVQQLVVFREVAAGGDANALLYDVRWLWLQVPSTLLGSFAQTAVGLYLSLGMALLYLDVRRRREGQDLKAELDDLLGAPRPGAAAAGGGAASEGEAP